MSFSEDFQRLAGIDLRDRVLLAETIVALAAASIAIRLLPFRKVVSAVTRDAVIVKADEAGDPGEIGRVRWAVEACARRLPWRIVCFQKGLAMHKLLSRRGIATALHYGVAQDEERGLSAHVWVTHGGQPVIGGEEAKGYTCLATFPSRDY